MEHLEIARRQVGSGYPVFVIAEAGVNHNGDLLRAVELVRAAKAAGADCVKFQTFKAERLAMPGAPKARYQLAITDPDESQLDMLRKLELPEAAYVPIIAECGRLGIVFMSTPYSAEDVDLLVRLEAPALKLASIHAAEPAFVRYAARAGRPLVLSTGMATLGEIDTAVNAARETGHRGLALLQCTTNYPSPPADANLRAMLTLRSAFQVPVGYSDHTKSPTTTIAAVALGAAIVEKHLTLDRALPGPDHSSSLEPGDFASLVAAIRETEASLGSGRKEPCEAERQNAQGMRRSIVARRAIPAGHTISAEDLTFKRPADGLAPAQHDNLVGRIARVAIAEGVRITWTMLGEHVESRGSQ